MYVCVCIDEKFRFSRRLGRNVGEVESRHAYDSLVITLLVESAAYRVAKIDYQGNRALINQPKLIIDLMEMFADLKDPKIKRL
jgi:hypothetical protein